MASSLECLGIAGPDEDPIAALGAALARIPGRLTPVARFGDEELIRFEDPSGVRLTITRSASEVLDVVPSFAGPPGARLSEVTAVGDDLVVADVPDVAEVEEIVTRLCCQLVHARLLPAGPSQQAAAVTALAHEVEAHPDLAAYDASLGTGLPWAAESFLPVGLFGDDPVSAFARLSGT
ncbi:hypothetical protein [Nocardioides pyridinolyticus]